MLLSVEQKRNLRFTIIFQSKQQFKEWKRASVARHTERNYEIGMLKLWYTMTHLYKKHVWREIQVNISSNTSKFNIFYK